METEVARENRRRHLDDFLPCRMAPLENFPDELFPFGWEISPGWFTDETNTGARAPIVREVFASRCCGYRNEPLPQELYDGMRAEEPTEAQRNALSAWMTETSFGDLLEGYAERAYTLRMLARAMRDHGIRRYYDVRTMNEIAYDPATVSDGIWMLTPGGLERLIGTVRLSCAIPPVLPRSCHRAMPEPGTALPVPANSRRDPNPAEGNGRPGSGPGAVSG